MGAYLSEGFEILHKVLRHFVQGPLHSEDGCWLHVVPHLHLEVVGELLCLDGGRHEHHLVTNVTMMFLLSEYF